MKEMRLVWGTLLLLLFVGAVWSGTTGTVSGVVTDQQGNPLANVAVMVLGTGLGAFTNASGYYTIVGVPAGTWDVQAQLIGYTTGVKSNVNVVADLRTPVNFSLKTEALVGYDITSYGEPLIREDIMSTRRTVTSDEMNRQVVDEFREVMNRTAGIVTEGNTDAGEYYHVRGGRDTEIVYIIDGVSVVNPITGGVGMFVNTNAIEQISILTGGWDAQYGEAQSGIINIVTKEGGNEHEGAFTFSKDIWQDRWTWDSQMLLESTGKPDPNQPPITWTTSTRQQRRTKVEGSFGGPITSKMSYFASGDWSHDWTIYPVKDPTIEWNATAKIAYRFSPKYKLTLSGNYCDTRMDRYDVQFQYLMKVPEPGYLDYIRRSWRASINWTQYITDNTFYILNIGRFDRWAKQHIPGATPDSYKIDVDKPPEEQRYLNREHLDPTGFFFTKGAERWYHTESVDYNTAKFDLTSMLNDMNELKTGYEIKLYNVDYYSLQPLPSNWYTDVYSAEPYSMAGYIQDKLEYKSMVVNLGVRFDLLNPNVEYPDNPLDYKERDPSSQYESWEDIPRKKATIKWQLSPRVGVSYPITERDKFHFSYGHFFQIPAFRFLYMSTQQEPQGAFPLVGYPDLEPQKTVQYELGVEHIFTETMVGDATVFIKDIRDLLDTERLDVKVGNITRFCNATFGNVKGFEVTLDKRLSKMFAAKVGYTFSIAKGLASSYRQGYDYAYYGWVLPQTENYLDWDQTHTIDLTLDIRDVERWGVNVTMVYGSGMPYSTSPEIGQPKINDKRMPWTLDLDVKANYDIHMWGMKYSLFAEVRNLLNRKNVQNLGADEGTGSGSDWTTWLYRYNDPDGPYDDMEVYCAPMVIRGGVSVEF
ncbi:MAG: hypothetical protein DRH44_01350 [Candidatus Coatesbacteria bacterium]|nr:MAG: hypothetical protein DRH44_01350 [Candidatus Coatesbacteria bacterium]